jgi:hypothetical protein
MERHKRSLAIDYALKRKREEKPEGGHLEPHENEVVEKEDGPLDHMDMYAMAKHRVKEAASKRERAMRMAGTPRDMPKHDEAAELEDDRDLGQHGEYEDGPEGPTTDAEDMHKMDEHAVENQEGGEDEDMVGRIMKQRGKSYAKGGDVDGERHMCSGGSCQHYSHGGEVSNSDLPIADDMPAQYDDLHLDDKLDDDGKAEYTGKNSGDELGDEREDHDREDIVSRIMKSRSKKDRMPRPA